MGTDADRAVPSEALLEIFRRIALDLDRMSDSLKAVEAGIPFAVSLWAKEHCDKLREIGFISNAPREVRETR